MTHEEELTQIAQKLYQGTRLSFSEGKNLFSTNNDLLIKDFVHSSVAKHTAKNVAYSLTLHLYPTNSCSLQCPLCSYYANEERKSWFFSPQEIERKVRNSKNFNEVHIVGGIDPRCSLDYYKEVFTRIRNISPKIHIKALTAPEIHFLATSSNLSIKETLLELKKCGLQYLPGGGAEILVDSIRKIIAPKKILSDEFLEIHEIAHNCGIPSNITMLFGHIEEYDDILLHLEAVRKLQDKTGMVQAFVPLPFQPENTLLASLGYPIKKKPLDRIFAVSRLMLDNISHIKVLWNYTGIDSAQKLLDWGGNDLGAVTQGEKISSTQETELMTEEFMREIIRKKSRVPNKSVYC